MLRSSEAVSADFQDRFSEAVVTAVSGSELWEKNKDIDTQLSAYDPWGLPSTFCMSRMTLSSTPPLRNPQHPPSIPILDTPILETKNFRVSSLVSSKVIHDIKDDSVLKVPCQEPSTSSKYPHEVPPILDTLLIKIST